ncbi:MAG: hypothetical protein QG604_214 [Candidatus Dependentiae bacterium]|nr:hypothetical protein [Candidatus Dependentiae bacterium]
MISQKSFFILFAALAATSLTPGAIKVIEQAPNSDIQRYFLALKGAYEQASGQLPRATQTYAQLKKILTSDQTFNFALLRLAFDRGNYEEVISYKNTVDLANPQAKEAFFLIAQAYLFLHNTTNAIELLEKLMSLYPHDDRFDYFATIAYTKINQPAKALTRIEAILARQEKRSKHYLFHFLKAKIAFAQSDFILAAEEAKKCLANNPSCAKAFFLLGGIEEKQQHIAQALAWYEHYRTLQPGDKEAIDKVISLSIKIGAYQKAQELLAQHPNTTFHYYHNVALLHLAQRQYTEAENAIDSALTKNFNSGTMQDLKITVLVAQRKFSQLATLLLSWLTTHPADKPLIKKIMALRKNNMPYRMLRSIMEQAAQKKGTWQLCFGLGDLVHEQNQYEAARSWYTVALQDPELKENNLIKSQLHYQIAGSYWSQQDRPHATEAVTKSLSCSPHCPEAEELMKLLAAPEECIRDQESIPLV